MINSKADLSSLSVSIPTPLNYQLQLPDPVLVMDYNEVSIPTPLNYQLQHADFSFNAPFFKFQFLPF